MIVEFLVPLRLYATGREARLYTNFALIRAVTKCHLNPNKLVSSCNSVITCISPTRNNLAATSDTNLSLSKRSLSSTIGEYSPKIPDSSNKSSSSPIDLKKQNFYVNPILSNYIQ